MSREFDFNKDEFDDIRSNWKIDLPRVNEGDHVIVTVITKGEVRNYLDGDLCQHYRNSEIYDLWVEFLSEKKERKCKNESY